MTAIAACIDSCSVCGQTHNAHCTVLQTFLPDRTLLQYQLTGRQRSHNKIMISKTADLNDRDFIVRMLYKDSY